MKSTSECPIVQLSRAEHWEIDQQGQIKHSSSGLDDLLVIIDYTLGGFLTMLTMILNHIKRSLTYLHTLLQAIV